MSHSIEQTVQVLREGGVIIFPTDTVYGIGAALSARQGIRKLYQIKNRPLSQPTALLCEPQCVFMQKTLNTSDSESCQKLIDTFWPGSLTIVFPLSDEHKEMDTVRIVSSDKGSIGVRCPDHPFLLELLGQLGEPLVATSANLRGGQTPITYQQVDQEIVQAVDLVIEGKSTLGVESTVIDVSSTPWQVIRQGKISREEIQQVVSDQVVA